MIATKILIGKHSFVIPVTRFFNNLAIPNAHREYGRVCARSSVIVVLASGATTFSQNYTGFI